MHDAMVAEKHFNLDVTQFCLMSCINSFTTFLFVHLWTHLEGFYKRFLFVNN